MVGEILSVEINSSTGIAKAIAGHRRLMAQLEQNNSVDVIDIKTNKVITLVLKNGAAVKTTLN